MDYNHFLPYNHNYRSVAVYSRERRLSTLIRLNTHELSYSDTRSQRSTHTRSQRSTHTRYKRALHRHTLTKIHTHKAQTRTGTHSVCGTVKLGFHMTVGANDTAAALPALCPPHTNVYRKQMLFDVCGSPRRSLSGVITFRVKFNLIFPAVRASSINEKVTRNTCPQQMQTP